MATWRWLFVFIFAAALTACGPEHKITYDYQQPTSERGQQCVLQCQKSKSICASSCSKKRAACVASARADARKKFNEYKLSNDAASDDKKTLEDFYDGSACDTKLCDCTPDYNACFEMCDGVLVPRRSNGE